MAYLDFEVARIEQRQASRPNAFNKPAYNPRAEELKLYTSEQITDHKKKVRATRRALEDRNLQRELSGL